MPTPRKDASRLRHLGARRHARHPPAPPSRRPPGATIPSRVLRSPGRSPDRSARAPYPIPSAGPYYLADRSSDVFVLRPNPNYHGQRPSGWTRSSTGRHRTGRRRGRYRARHDRLRRSTERRLDPQTVSARAAGARYRLTANNWTARLALNTSRAPFSDASTRRAVALALDRRQLARALGDGDFQLPTSALLPPNLRGPARPAYPLRPT